MNWKYSVTAIPAALMLAGIMSGCTQSSSKEVRIVAEERQEGSISQKKQVEEVRQDDHWFCDKPLWPEG